MVCNTAPKLYGYSIKLKVSNYYTIEIDNNCITSKAKVERIDNFIIHLIRDHIVKAIKCTENNLIMASYYVGEEYIYRTIQNEYSAPEAFLYLDKYGYIQNERSLPVSYHIHRRALIRQLRANKLQRVIKDLMIACIIRIQICFQTEILKNIGGLKFKVPTLHTAFISCFLSL